MAIVSERFLGIALDYLGHIEHDDAVWLTVRRRQPLLIDSPTSKSARNIERVARRILALLAAQREPAEPPSRRAPPLARDGPDDALRGARRRARARPTTRSAAPTSASARSSATGGLPVVSSCATRSCAHEQARIEEALRHAARSGAPPRLRSLRRSRTTRRLAVAPARELRRSRRRARDAPGRARARDQRRDRSSPARCSARCASRRASSSPTSRSGRRSRPSHLSAIEDEALRRAARARVRRRASCRRWRSSSSSTPRRSSKTYMRRLRERRVARVEDALIRDACAAGVPSAAARERRAAISRSRRLLFVVGAACRASTSRIAWAREPVWDGHYYDFGARRIAAGLGYSDDVTRRRPAGVASVVPLPVGYSGVPGLLLPGLRQRPARRHDRQRDRRRAARRRRHRLARHATRRARARDRGGAHGALTRAHRLLGAAHDRAARGARHRRSRRWLCASAIATASRCAARRSPALVARAPRARAPAEPPLRAGPRAPRSRDPARLARRAPARGARSRRAVALAPSRSLLGRRRGRRATAA